MPETIQEEWIAFEKQVIPHTASSGHITEMYEAFYAGALCMFRLITKLPDDDDEADKAMESYLEEFEDFIKAIEKDCGR